MVSIQCKWQNQKKANFISDRMLVHLEMDLLYIQNVTEFYTTYL